MLNFFASWCDPCRDEMPLINELATKGDKEGYSVLGVAVEDTRAAITEFSKEAKLLFPVALDLNNVRQALLSHLWPTGDVFHRRPRSHPRHRTRTADPGARSRSA